MPRRHGNPVTVRPIETGEIIGIQTRAIPEPVKRAVWARDGLCCRYCGYRSQDVTKFQLDHVHPHSLGGLATVDNIVVACGRCNAMKGAQRGWVPLTVKEARQRGCRQWYPPKAVRPAT